MLVTGFTDIIPEKANLLRHDSVIHSHPQTNAALGQLFKLQRLRARRHHGSDNIGPGPAQPGDADQLLQGILAENCGQIIMQPGQP